MFTIQNLIDDAKCYQQVRQMRWPEGVRCPHCESERVTKRGFHTNQPHRQRYQCHGCDTEFDDLTLTIFEGHRQPLKVWIICLYFMGLNLSNAQIGKELGLNKDDVQAMTRALRTGIVVKKKSPILEGEIEFDEVYVVAGHKGHPDQVEAQGREGRRRRLKGSRGRGTLEKEKPPIFGMIQRGGQVILKMLPNVKQTTIRPIIEANVAAGSLIYTDEYNIYSRLLDWGFAHKTVNHSIGEYARDEDGDDFHEVHVNTIEGFWSLLRSWLRPHRGISQEKLPLYLGFFEFIHNIRQRGKALLPALLDTLLLPPCNPS